MSRQKAIYEVVTSRPDGYDNLSEFMPHNPEYMAIWHDKYSNTIHKFNNDVPAYWKENKITDLNELDRYVESRRLHKDEPEPQEFVKYFNNNWESTADDYARDLNKYSKGIINDAPMKIIQKGYAAEGKIVPAQYTGIEITNFLNQLRGVKERGYVIQQSIQTINVPYIEGKIIKRTGNDLQTNLNTSDEIRPVRDEFTTITYEIKMHGTHIQRNEDIYLRPLALDPYQVTLNGIQQRVTKMKAQIIKAVLAAWAGTPTSGEDWGAQSGGLSTYRPFDSIQPAASAIYAADGEAEVIVTNDIGASSWETNHWNLGAGTQSPATSVEAGKAKVMNLKGLGYQVYCDPIWSDASALLMQKDAALAFQGNTKIATYDNVHTRSDGYYFWTYFGAKLIESDKMKEITGIYTP